MSPDSEAANAAECAGWPAPLNYETVAERLKVLKVFAYKDEGEFTFGDVFEKYWHLMIAFFSVFIILVLVTIFIFRLHHNLKLANKKLEHAIAECIVIENELKKSEAKYRSLFESTPDAIMTNDKNGFIDCNVATLNMFCFSSKEEFVSQSPAQVSPLKQPNGRDSQEASLVHIEEALTKGSTFFEWVHKKKDGTTFPAEVMLSRLEVEGKDITQALVRDVTSRKQIETERERLINEIQEALGQVKTLKGMLLRSAQTAKRYETTKATGTRSKATCSSILMLLLLMASARTALNNSIQSYTRREKRGKKKPGNSIDARHHSFTAGLIRQKKTIRTPSPQI
jgi:PAS domain S-box-containing protein